MILVGHQVAEDGHGNLDALLVANWFTPDQLWLNNGSGHLVASPQTLGVTYTRGVAIGDLDGDGDLDYFAATGLNQGNRVWFNLDSAAPFDLSVDLTANRTFAVQGEILTYTILVRNLGPTGVMGAKVWDEISGPVDSAEIVNIETTSGATSSLVAGTIVGGFLNRST